MVGADLYCRHRHKLRSNPHQLAQIGFIKIKSGVWWIGLVAGGVL